MPSCVGQNRDWQRTGKRWNQSPSKVQKTRGEDGAKSERNAQRRRRGRGGISNINSEVS